MMISKLFKTETSHIVREAVSKRCKNNIHGHSYLWKVFIKCNFLQSNGMVLDFKELKPIKDFIDLFDHATVFWENEELEIIDFFKKKFDRVLIMKQNPTAENMARLICKFTNEWLEEKFEVYMLSTNFYKCVRVEVYETETGCGICEIDDYDSNDILVYQHNNEY